MIVKSSESQVGSLAAQAEGGEGRGRGGVESRDKGGAIQVDGGVNGAESVIEVESRRGYGRNAKEISLSFRNITDDSLSSALLSLSLSLALVITALVRTLS